MSQESKPLQSTSCCSRCCRCTLWLVVGLIVLLATLGTLDLIHAVAIEDRSIERRLGKSELADPKLYDDIVLSAQQRDEFFRDGAIVIRKALKLETLQAVKRAVDAAPKVMEHSSWMASDAILDFFVYSNLGGIISQLLQAGNTDNVQAADRDSVYFWQDFTQQRLKTTNGWHVDNGECTGDVPANYTLKSFPRIVICVNSSSVNGTVLLNQSVYADSIVSKRDAELFWRGELPYRRATRFEETFGFPHNTTLPLLPGVVLPETGATIAPSLEAGDVLVFSACAWHRTPDNFVAHELFLQPSFAPSRLYFKDFHEKRPPILSGWGRHCEHMPSNVPISSGHPCHPQVYPKDKRPAPGTEITARRERRYTLLEGIVDFIKLKRRAKEQKSHTEL
eukprot:TRINITY_DN28929_c0_g1_i1.p1 TRINITY_DN28929_c0_g1~~TRINITY_DN28929_c0_g1_i1.p1  ORF type:complete len:393 (+),score=34.02 TRINITY_DN28929_c0_g1_i1:142-1320(+)